MQSDFSELEFYHTQLDVAKLLSTEENAISISRI